MGAFISFIRGTIGLAAFLLALACALGAVGGLGGFRSNRLDILTHFAPFWLAGGVIALLLIPLAGRGRFTAIAGTIAILAAGALMAPELLAALRQKETPASGETFKLVQFNLWGRNSDPSGTAAWILAQNADVVVVEEAFGTTDAIIAALRHRYPFATTCAEPFPCSTMILTREAPVDRGGFEGRVRSHVPGAWVTLAGGGRPFTVVGVHYTWPIPAGPQQMQRARLVTGMTGFDKQSLIISGDFNSTPWSFSLRRQDQEFGVERRTRALFSWPAASFSRWNITTPFPVLAIDHVYAGSEWRTVSVRRGPRLGSDHYPVVVVLSRNAD